MNAPPPRIIEEKCRSCGKPKRTWLLCDRWDCPSLKGEKRPSIFCWGDGDFLVSVGDASNRAVDNVLEDLTRQLDEMRLDDPKRGELARQIRILDDARLANDPL